MNPATVCQDRFEIIFAENGNSDAFVVDGWSRPSEDHRWSFGEKSTVRLPPLAFAPSALITIVMAPYIPTGGSRYLSVIINGMQIDEFPARAGLGHYGFIVPKDTLFPDRDNFLTFIHSNVAAPDLGGAENRLPAIAFRRMRVEPCLVGLYEQPEQLAAAANIEVTADVHANLVEQFQSLGQNCEFGMFQRKCGAEPLGLLRFSTTLLPILIHEIATRFEGIDNLAELSFTSKGSGTEYMGHQKTYGLDYHTFKKEGEVEIDKLARSEAARLGYLARMLMEQIEDAAKIFVVQRQPNLTLREVLPLLQALRIYNTGVALLWVTVSTDDEKGKIGIVERVGERFYHGFIDRFAPVETVPQFSFDVWKALCCLAIRAAEQDKFRTRQVMQPAT